MHIAIVAATDSELEALRARSIQTQHKLSFHVHGIGMMMSTFHLQKIVQTAPDFIIQCGIAGAFSRQLELGETVIVASEQLGDTGSQDHTEFLDLFDLGFLQPNEFPFTNQRLINPYIEQYQAYKHAHSLTVNTGSGNIETVNLRASKYQCDIESMEGGCLHYVCLQHKIPFVQFRGISNYVEPRNKSSWKIIEAIQSCQDTVCNFIEQYI